MLSHYEKIKPELLDIIMQLEQFYMVSHLNHKGSITYTNKEFLSISKWTPKRVIGKTFWQMFSCEEADQQEADKIWRHVEKGKPWSGTVKKITKSNEPYYVNMTAIPVIGENDNLFSVITFEMDMTKDVQLQHKLEEIASFDYETGLLSRHNLETTVNALIAKNEGFTFVNIVIDRFYTLEDFHSNESRKEIIQAFVNRMKHFFQNSQIARIGVNEFVILTNFGEWFIEGFNDFLKRHPIYIDNVSLPITASGGIIRYPENQKTYTELMNTSVVATKEAIELGGARFTTLSKASHKALNRKALISQKMLAAIDHEHLQVVFQPQVDSQTGKVLLYESLVRWEDSELGTISPDELIPIAEENGLIQRIGEFVLNEAANLAASLNHAGVPTMISVNTSVREFTNPRRNKQILRILQDADCPPALIQLEITEMFAFKAEVEHSISHQMSILKDAGIEFALDNFGRGYASFRYMQTLPISTLKIDKHFINSLTTHVQTTQLVRGMIQFAKSLEMFVIAEGVETEEQADLLKAFGIDGLQGYYIGHPVGKEEVLAVNNCS